MDELTKLYVQHLIGLNRLENLGRAKVLKLIQAAFDAVNAELTGEKDLTKYQRARQLALFKRTGSILQEAYGKVNTTHKADMLDIGKMSTKFTEKVLTTSGEAVGVEINTTRLTEAQISKIVELPIHGFTRSEWWAAQAIGMGSSVRKHIQLGLFSGQSMSDITKKVMEISANRARNEASAIVRTAVTAVSAETQFQSLKEHGEDVTKEYEYVAVLDDRTSEICAELDGSTWEYDDKKAPRPPLHINCRSTIVAVINWEALGVDPTAIKGLRFAEKAAQGGPGKYKTYSDWLAKQPLSVKQDVLGKTKGTLFHQEEISLKDLIKKDQSVMTTQELVNKLKLTDPEVGKQAEIMMKQNQGVYLPGQTEPFTAPKGTFAAPEVKAAMPKVKAAEAINPITVEKAVDSILADLPKPDLDGNNMEALSYYQTSGYRSMNQLLRLNKRPDIGADAVKERIVWLEEALNKAPALKHDVQVYRGLSAKGLTGEFGEKAFAKLKQMEGKTLTDKGFVSTSSHREVALDGFTGFGEDDTILFEIALPKGTPGIWMPIVTGRMQHEFEFLLQKGSIFKIVSVTRDPDVGIIVKLERVS
jgi:SPP1 gp7 family putative phage head morphogenesis protein